MINLEIAKLREAGLTDYEARTYLALLRFGVQTGREVAKNSDVPPTRVFDALKNLVDKGLVSLLQERPMIFKAIEPDVSLRSMFEKKLEELKILEKETVSILKEIKKEETKPKIHEKVTVILGFQKMFNYFVNLTNKAKERVLVFSVGEEIPFSVKKAIKKAVTSGLDTRFIASKCDDENRHILEGHKELGWKMRYCLTTQEYTFSVVDNIAMINVRNPKIKEERISIFFEIEGLAQALTNYFEKIWKTSKSIKF